jgi:2-hydroxy-3-keto-5-methylthiopentenyl-1-phosphate phosphatase
MSMVKAHVYVDFDGTIAPDDPTDALFDAFADPSWHEVETQWQAGQLTSRECMQRQANLLRCTPEEMKAFLDQRRIDPHFVAFVSLCERHGADVTILSDGFEQVVGHLLANAGLSLPYFANRLKYEGKGQWSCQFPHATGACRSRMGNCKCSHQLKCTETVRVAVGDGRSDFCMAEHSHFVLCKGQLSKHCQAVGLVHRPFENFADAIQTMSDWFRAWNRRKPHQIGRSRDDTRLAGN